MARWQLTDLRNSLCKEQLSYLALCSPLPFLDSVCLPPPPAPPDSSRILLLCSFVHVGHWFWDVFCPLDTFPFSSFATYFHRVKFIQLRTYHVLNTGMSTEDTNSHNFRIKHKRGSLSHFFCDCLQ